MERASELPLKERVSICQMIKVGEGIPGREVYGPNGVPHPNSSVEFLTPSTSKCDSIWRYGP